MSAREKHKAENDHPFSTGEVIITNGLYEMISGETKYANSALQDFISCNWTPLEDSEKLRNWRSVVFGGGILGDYILNGEKICIYTTPSRKYTIMCMKSEIESIILEND